MSCTYDTYYTYSDYGITPAQYHHKLDMLWECLGYTTEPLQNLPGADVFTLCIGRIKMLEQRVEDLENQLTETGEKDE